MAQICLIQLINRSKNQNIPEKFATWQWNKSELRWKAAANMTVTQIVEDEDEYKVNETHNKFEEEESKEGSNMLDIGDTKAGHNFISTNTVAKVTQLIYILYQYPNTSVCKFKKESCLPAVFV